MTRLTSRSFLLKQLMVPRLQCWVNYSMRRQFYCHKTFPDINTTRFLASLKLFPHVTLEPGATDNTTSQ